MLRTLLESSEVSLLGCGVESIPKNVRRRTGQVRPRATTATDDQYILLTASRIRTDNAIQLERQLVLSTGRRVSS